MGRFKRAIQKGGRLSARSNPNSLPLRLSSMAAVVRKAAIAFTAGRREEGTAAVVQANQEHFEEQNEVEMKRLGAK